MLRNETYLEIDDLLKSHANPKFAESRNRLIDKNTTSYGVKIATIRRLVSEYVDSNPKLLDENCLSNCESLLSSTTFDVQMAGIFLASSLNLKNSVGREKLFDICQRWVESYVNDWAVCDTLSTEVLSKILHDDKASIEFLSLLGKSTNKWARRATLVTLIKARSQIRTWPQFLQRTLEIYKNENDPIVKKAINWAKREA